MTLEHLKTVSLWADEASLYVPGAPKVDDIVMTLITLEVPYEYPNPLGAADRTTPRVYVYDFGTFSGPHIDAGTEGVEVGLLGRVGKRSRSLAGRHYKWVGGSDALVTRTGSSYSYPAEVCLMAPRERIANVSSHMQYERRYLAMFIAELTQSTRRKLTIDVPKLKINSLILSEF